MNNIGMNILRNSNKLPKINDYGHRVTSNQKKNKKSSELRQIY